MEDKRSIFHGVFHDGKGQAKIGWANKFCGGLQPMALTKMPQQYKTDKKEASI